MVDSSSKLANSRGPNKMHVCVGLYGYYLSGQFVFKP